MPSYPPVEGVKRALEGAGLEPHAEDLDLLVSAASWPKEWASIVAGIYPTRLLERSIDAHALALRQASDSSERVAVRLVRATWCLVVATIALVFATVALGLRAAP